MPNSKVSEATCQARYAALHEDIITIKTNHLPHIQAKVDKILWMIIGLFVMIVAGVVIFILTGGL